MTPTAEPTYRQVGIDGKTAPMCLRCGALVLSAPVHDTWHATHEAWHVEIEPDHSDPSRTVGGAS